MRPLAQDPSYKARPCSGLGDMRGQRLAGGGAELGTRGEAAHARPSLCFSALAAMTGASLMSLSGQTTRAGTHLGAMRPMGAPTPSRTTPRGCVCGRSTTTTARSRTSSASRLVRWAGPGAGPESGAGGDWWRVRCGRSLGRGLRAGIGGECAVGGAWRVTSARGPRLL